MKELPARDQKYPLFSFPTFDSSGKEDPVDIQERRLICRLAQSPKISQEDISFLESLNWNFSRKFGNRKHIFSPWGALKSASKLSQLQQDLDYFRSRQDVVSFIVKTGSCRTQQNQENEAKTQLSICSPSVASEDEDDLEDGAEDSPIQNQADLEKELRQTIAASGENYLFPMIRQILEDLGWKFEIRVNASLASDIIFSPWGWKLYQSSSDQPLLHGREYFVDHNEVVTYVAKHQNNSCSDAALKKTFPRRSLAGSGAQLLSSEIILKSSGTNTSKEVIPLPTTSKKNAVTKPSTTKVITEPPTRRLSKSPEKLRPQPKEVKVTPSITAPGGEMIPNKNFKYTFEGEDLCPSLKRFGLEGQIKHALNTSVDNYCFSRIQLVLQELGWNFHYRYKGSTVNLAPWAETTSSIILRLGVDYFLNPRDICEYLTKHGHKPITGEPSRRRNSSSTAAVVVPPAVVVEEKKRGKGKKPKKEPKPSNVPRVGVDDVTLSQIQCLESEVDRRCSAEIVILLEKAVRSRPRLNLSEFEQVWGVLSSNGWVSESSSSSEDGKEVVTFARLSSEGVKTHSFESETDVLDFIEKQIVARGQNYVTLVDRADFFPLTSFEDEDDDDAGEQQPEPIEEEDEDEEDTEDINDVCDMNISSPLLDALSSYGMENDTPPPPTQELKRKSFSSSNETVGGGLLEELEAEIQTKRLRTEEVAEEAAGENVAEAEVPVVGEEEGEEGEEEEELNQLLLPAIECAKQNLIPSHVPTFPVGREEEFQQILLYLDRMTRSSFGSLRVSGLHGQGKTVTTHIAIQRFHESGVQFQVVWLSATMISSFQDIIKALPRNTPSSPVNHDQNILQQILHQSSSPILLVIDEIDLLQARIRDSLLSLANTKNSKLMLIGLENSAHSGSFNHSITFQAYNESSLSRILNSLTKQLFDEKSIQLVSKSFATKGSLPSLLLLPQLMNSLFPSLLSP